MPSSSPARLRAFWWWLHRWIGIGLCLLLVPIAVSGALLVWKDELDALVHPARYAVTGGEIAQPLSAYIASAASALEGGLQPVAVRFPEREGWPVQVQARGSAREGRPQFVTVYLDPPTGRVLEAVEFRSSLFGFLHRFHENLAIPAYSGRAIVGWAGVGMLILSLTGIWLWWPRNGAFLPGLRWRRAPATSTNLHHLLGFWISLPLAFVSLTGIYLSFPPYARSLMSSIAPMNPPGRSFLRGQIAHDVKLTPDDALAAAQAAQPQARPSALFLATMQSNETRRGAGAQSSDRPASRNAGPSPIWRIQLRKPESGELVTMLVDDASGAARPMPDPLAGDRAAQWIRWLHEGSHSGQVWRMVVFLTGVFPPIFAFTGVLMWLRGRRQRKALARGSAPQGNLQAAE
jgi:uncharacterized iron-regulated membrane protein